jgi:hypothetical protein
MARPALVALVLLCGCASEQLVTVRFAGEPDDALVTVDDRYIGRLGALARRGLRLPPGRHRITVEKAGFFPYDVIVEADGEGERVTVSLTPVPD